MKIFTIGFTQKTAEEFFGLLDHPDISRLIDIRRNNHSQLAGFTKELDLKYFLEKISKKEYAHVYDLAPSGELLKIYRSGLIEWKEFETKFLYELEQRGVKQGIRREDLAGACLLCSEPTPEHCHRRLVAEYFSNIWGDVDIIHL